MDLVSDACSALRGYLLLGNEVFQADGATFVRNTACRRRHDANFVTDVRCRTQGEVERLLARSEREFAGFGHRQFQIDPQTPPALAARLALDGFPFSEQLVMVLEGDLRATPPQLDLRAVDGDPGWANFASLQHSDWDEVRHKQGKPPAPAVTIDFLVSKRCKQPQAQFWIVHVGSRPAAYLSSWAAGNGIGVIEDLFTHPDFRLRGLATGLLAHGIADLRRRGAATFILSAVVDDTPKTMYAAMGFTPLCVTRVYNRSVP